MYLVSPTVDSGPLRLTKGRHVAVGEDRAASGYDLDLLGFNREGEEIVQIFILLASSLPLTAKDKQLS